MADTAVASGSGQHASNYLDGAPAADAFQGLIDRGLFTDQAPAKQAPAQASPQTPAAQPEPSLQRAQPEVAEPAAETAPEQPEPVEYSNLDEYLTKSQLDREAFLSLPVTAKVDGRDVSVPLKDLLRSYQTDAHVTQRSQALAEKQRAWEAEQTQAKAVFAQQFQAAQQITQFAHQQVMHEFQGINWDKLQAENPLEWNIQRTKLNDRFQAVQQAMQQLNTVQQQQTAETQQRQAQAVEQERSRMLEVFPEWRDPQKFQAATGELKSYAKTIGFNDAELAGIADHRYMKVLRDASLYAALQAKSPAVLKMVRAAPPMGQPGARTQRDPRAARLQQVRDAGRKGLLARDTDAQNAAFSALVDAGA